MGRRGKKREMVILGCCFLVGEEKKPGQQVTVEIEQVNRGEVL